MINIFSITKLLPISIKKAWKELILLTIKIEKYEKIENYNKKLSNWFKLFKTNGLLVWLIGQNNNINIITSKLWLSLYILTINEYINNTLMNSQ